MNATIPAKVVNAATAMRTHSQYFIGSVVSDDCLVGLSLIRHSIDCGDWHGSYSPTARSAWLIGSWMCIARQASSIRCVPINLNSTNAAPTSIAIRTGGAIRAIAIQWTIPQWWAEISLMPSF